MNNIVPDSPGDYNLNPPDDDKCACGRMLVYGWCPECDDVKYSQVLQKRYMPDSPKRKKLHKKIYPNKMEMGGGKIGRAHV